VLLTRSPLGTTRCCHLMGLARLACVKHAASVRPEPGSNSPSEIVEILGRTHRSGHGKGFALVWNSMPWRTSMLTITASKLEEMGDTRDQPDATVFWLIRSPDVPSTVIRGSHNEHEPAALAPL
jgi:hypothetical protein